MNHDVLRLDPIGQFETSLDLIDSGFPVSAFGVERGDPSSLSPRIFKKGQMN